MGVVEIPQHVVRGGMAHGPGMVGPLPLGHLAVVTTEAARLGGITLGLGGQRRELTWAGRLRCGMGQGGDTPDPPQRADNKTVMTLRGNPP